MRWMNSLPAPLQPANVVLLVVDMQDRLLPAMQDSAAITAATVRMIQACQVLEIPVIATEQYPRGLGRTCPSVSQALGQLALIEKVRFSACVPEVAEQIKQHGRPAVIVVGIEAHVCIQQTVLDLLREQRTVYVCADATGSRRQFDAQIALHRMRQAGAIVTTTESLLFEMLGSAQGSAFKRILEIVK